MLTRVIDFLKNEQNTSLFTSLTVGGETPEEREVGIYSLMDTWLRLKMVENDGEFNRLLYVLKSRGMAHSNQLREFVLTDQGIELVDVYIGSGQILTGSARLVQSAKDRAQAVCELQDIERLRRELEQEQQALKAQAQTMATRMDNIAKELQVARQHDKNRQEIAAVDRRGLAASRRAD